MGKERVRGKYVRRVRGAVRRAAKEERFQKGTGQTRDLPTYLCSLRFWC